MREGSRLLPAGPPQLEAIRPEHAVKEIEKLHTKKHLIENSKLTAGTITDLTVSGDLFDIRATFELRTADTVGLSIGGERVFYDVAGNNLNGAAMKPVRGTVSLQVLVDRPSLEICGNNGRVFITKPRDEKGDVSTIRAFADGGDARLLRLEVNELQSVWQKE